ncbi:MarR family transcriptional regulator [Pseudomonas sp. BGr12]|uniref:MarR family transcriptional regulator n=1 Tax=Pseudomonas denitrificans TaxID=43306 RepID=A0A9X7MXB9_PSEDE|nr:MULTISPECIES: MarR family transcriptional regulator [Pseudomonadaceae]OQR27962.1 MarR family transcriptional regulator [Pseudomonas sp. T]MBD9504050.1 MarR family transcriptional regulator [Pseudomonas sp. PDM17]MBD9516790.1 MarR family transcriptional regulator [Pseudomonas sp. PDM22]MBD9578451.1 MarR family transcriptional regulator [Pseudomonas sp. PDM23]MBD9628573.1 MarR family transcriptional regulator [Pseudomonas sp. PDM19]
MPDLIKNALQLQAMEAFFFSYRAFTAKPDEMLERRGLSRVHHRILFFIARNPGLSVSELLSALGVTKQALNVPLRQLLERDLIRSEACDNDKRRRLLELTAEGGKLEKALRQEQGRLLQRAFDEAGEDAVRGWLAVNQAIAWSQDED